MPKPKPKEIPIDQDPLFVGAGPLTPAETADVVSDRLNEPVAPTVFDAKSPPLDDDVDESVVITETFD